MQKFSLNLISFNYKSLDLISREKFFVYDNELESIIIQLKETFNLKDIFIISTCNRTELYYSSENIPPHQIVKCFFLLKNISYETYADQVKIITGKETLTYFFRMALGLESQVPGDIQLINQVKKAYKHNVAYQSYSPQMHRLIHLIFYTNKQVTNQTEFKSGTASISYSVVELIKKRFAEPQNLNILLAGIGDIGTDVAKNLRVLNPKSVTLANRTKTKALQLAQELNFSTVAMDNIDEAFSKADIIISSLSVKKPFFKPNIVGVLDSKHRCLIDLSLPRSIAEEFRTLSRFELYNIDDINAQIADTLECRRRQIPKVIKIIDENLNDFENWISETSFTPTIQKFKKCLDEIRRAEINRYANQLTENQIESVDLVTKSMLNKIVKLPVVQIKSACKRDEADNIVEALADLFDLERINLDMIQHKSI